MKNQDAEKTDDVFETLAADLEKSIQTTEKSDEPKDLAAVLTKAARDFLAKGSGSDLQAEADKRGTLLVAGKDPAESPKKSGDGYKDSSKYEARKGEKEECDDEDDDDKMPAFFKKKKKGKKAVKKASAEEVEETEDDDDQDAVDATEFMEGVEKSITFLMEQNKELSKGLACFGELLADLADPRKDKVLVSMAKAISFLVEGHKTLSKSVEGHSTLMKAISTMPGVPRVAGLQTVVTDADADAAAPQGKTLSKSQKDRLFQLAVQKKISHEEMKKAVQTGDATILEQFKGGA